MSSYHAHKHAKARKTLIVKKVIQPKLIDRLVYLAAIVEPMFSLPQAYQIFHDKTAAGVSILSWLGFECMTVIWLWYAIAHKEKMILVYQGLFFIIDGSVLLGAIFYGGKFL